MTLVENLQTWKDAVEHYNKGDFQSSLDKFKEMKESSAKISFNIGRAYLSLCDLQAALQVSIVGLYLNWDWIMSCILTNIYNSEILQ
jgi:hypothetical protein